MKTSPLTRFIHHLIGSSILALTIAFSASSAETRSLAHGEQSPAAELEQLSWLIGYWVGEGIGGVSIETISPPVGGVMSGHFEQVNAGKLKFTEFYQFAVVGDSIEMRIKHFGPDMVAWEEPTEMERFALVAIEADAVYFDGLTMRLDDQGRLESHVRVEDDGTEIQFIFERRELVD